MPATPTRTTSQEHRDLDAQKARRAQQFFAGQIVRLRCGGPLMMVEAPEPIAPGPDAKEGAPVVMGVMCCWFHGGTPISEGSRYHMNGGQLCRERFAVELLLNCDPAHGANFDGSTLDEEPRRAGDPSIGSRSAFGPYSRG